jgi:membrane associated rhomboid family serine protease
MGRASNDFTRSALRTWLRESQVHLWIFVLAACFAVQTLTEVLGWAFALDVENSLLRLLALHPLHAWHLGEVWTLVTYGFLHYGFMHLLLNALMLYFAGHMLKTFWLDAQVSRLFVLGMVAGGIAYVLASLRYPNWPPLVGASGGVLALLLAATRLSPSMPVYIFGILRLPLWGVSLLLLAVSVSGLQGPNAGGNFAHLGGALAGWALAKSPSWLFPETRWISMRRKKSSKTSHLHVVSSDGLDLDGILDKIGRVGYDGLTAKEKAFLARYGKK